MDATASASRSVDSPSLKDELVQALPTGLRCRIRYIHTPPQACDALFSALPGQKPEKTRLASHFLTVSVDAAAIDPDATGDVISFSIEVLVYSTKRLVTIFVSKVDSTAYTPKHRPSPVKTTVTTFLRWLALQQRRKRPHRKVVISLFARAQAQYLFPGSSEDKRKHILDDRQLIKWWARTLDPIFPTSHDRDARYQAYITVPGYVGSELRSFMPAPPPAASPDRLHWLPGHPLLDLARTRGLPEHAPPRCLLPRFPDDPKARFMQDLDEEIGIAQNAEVTASPSKRKSGRWNSVSDLERFWEAMEYRQECSSGRVVGFLWLVISPTGSESSGTADVAFGDDNGCALPNRSNLPSQGSLSSTSIHPTKQSRRKGRLTGPIVPRQPRLKSGSSSTSNCSKLQAQLDASAGDGVVVTKESYDKIMQTLLHLDFSSLDIAVRSTAKWVADTTSVATLDVDAAVQIDGTVQADDSARAGMTDGVPKVNDLGTMVRKKRKATGEVMVDQHKAAPAQDGESIRESGLPVVNQLGGSLIRKRPKPAVAG